MLVDHDAADLNTAQPSRSVHDAEAAALPIDDFTGVDGDRRKREGMVSEHREAAGTRIDEHAAAGLGQLDALRLRRAWPDAHAEHRRLVTRLKIEQPPFDRAVAPSLERTRL